MSGRSHLQLQEETKIEWIDVAALHGLLDDLQNQTGDAAEISIRPRTVLSAR